MTGIVDEFVEWLTAFLPADYLDRYAEYRWDIGLRRAHQAAAYEAGWLQPGWSREHGGRDLGPADVMAVRLESAIRSAPKLPNIAGPGVVAPGLRHYGTDEQKQRLLVPLLRGDEWWALGMSEPEAGSDFGGLRTRAERTGDSYVVNGQKIWTTQAHESKWATLYARTDPDAPKHKGITCFILDLESPGVTIRPIRMATVSDETFCEVFLDNVEIPAASILGAENAGWSVAMRSLEHERDMIWIMNWVEIERGLRTAARHAQPIHFEALGRRLADSAALRATGYRGLEDTLAGRSGTQSQILKLLGSETLQQTWELAAAAAGPAAIADPDLAFERHDALAATIYGGTSDIQRNIIGERVLGTSEVTMDYDLGDSSRLLRERLRALIAEHLPEGFLGAFSNDPADLARTQAFCKTLADEGLLCLAWPKEYGGGGGSVWEQTTVREEMWAHHEPRGAQYMGVNWVGPALMRHGTDAQRDKHLPLISSGEVIWCQGFSEPEAGTDLASLRTRAVPDDAGWLITGQKVWTSYALMAQYCVLAACTDPEAPSAKRLTLFIVPMDRAGIEVRPIATMLGPHHLNEVFLDNVRVTEADVLGQVGDGWTVMRDALAYERVGIARYARCESLLARLQTALEAEGLWEQLTPSLRTRWVRAIINLRVAKLLAYSAVAQQDAGIDPAAAAAARIVTTTCDQAVAELLVEAAGSASLDAGYDAPIHGAIDDHWRYAQAATVSSGTIEVQRILVARSVLGSSR